MHHAIHASRARRLRGASLIYFSIAILGFFAVAALVIDVGFVVLGKRQLLGAVESASATETRLNAGLPSYLDDGVTTVRRRSQQIFESHYTEHIQAGDAVAASEFVLGAGAEAVVDGSSPGIELNGGSVIAAEGIEELRDWTPDSSLLDFSVANQVTLRRDGTPAPCLPRLFSRAILSRNVNGVPMAEEALDGVVVQASAKSEFGPAMTFGVSHAAEGIVGVEGIVLPETQWPSVITGGASDTRTLFLTDTIRLSLVRPLSIGSQIIPTTPVPPNSGLYLIPLVREYTVVAGQPNQTLVVGCSLMLVSFADHGDADPMNDTITFQVMDPVAQQVATNASMGFVLLSSEMPSHQQLSAVLPDNSGLFRQLQAVSGR